MGENKNNNINIEEIINKAVEKAFLAGRKLEKMERKKKRSPYFEEAERRLRAYPDLKLKIEKTLLDIEDLKKEIVDYQKTGQAQGRSKDIVCITNLGGRRISFIEKKEALILDRELSLRQTQKEIHEIDETIDILSWQDKNKTVTEPWIDTVKLKYFENMKDDEIAELLHCDKTTVWRNRSRIMNRLLTLWYGIKALRCLQ